MLEYRIRRGSWRWQMYNWVNQPKSHLSKCITSWKNLKNCWWTTHCSRYKIKLWGINIPTRNNGGRQCKSSQRSKSKKTWSWLELTNRFTNSSCLGLQISSMNHLFLVFVEIGTNTKTISVTSSTFGFDPRDNLLLPPNRSVPLKEEHVERSYFCMR
jgi:hypothetical protein